MSLDDLAAAESTAPSQPPPTLPLTRDERLIHRFIELHSTFELAALLPSVQQAHERAEREAFNDFFTPPSASPDSQTQQVPPPPTGTVQPSLPPSTSTPPGDPQ